MSKEIDIRPLKRFAIAHLHDYPILQKIILEDEDKIFAEEFIVKVKIWLSLLRQEKLATQVL
ncbi:MAG: hypothetical protein ABDI20_08665 [Candidatus Bipolaricaulaceae bacterium]